VDQPPGSITKKAVASKKVSREHEHERGGHIQNEKNEGSNKSPLRAKGESNLGGAENARCMGKAAVMSKAERTRGSNSRK